MSQMNKDIKRDELFISIKKETPLIFDGLF